MCLALPARVVALTGTDTAKIDLAGVQKEISTALLENVAVGDYVIVHVGYALTLLDPAEARAHARRVRERGSRPGAPDAAPLAPALRPEDPTMNYIDEFRDGGVARKIADADRREAQPGRRYQLMEFCGGHTHAIARYGVDGPAAGQREHDPRAGLPGVRAADRAHRHARSSWRSGPARSCAPTPTRMRVPASGGLSLLKAKAAGADVRMVYSAADALRIAQRASGARGGVLRHRLRDHDAAHGAGDPAGARRWASRTSPCSATTC